MKKSLLIVVVMLISTFAQVLAQAPESMAPPKGLLIVREEIKPGMMGAHSRHSAHFAEIFNQLQTPNHRIALVPVAGNENEVIYITPVDSFAEIESINQATDNKMGAATGSMRVKLDGLEKEAPSMHNAMRDMWAIYRPELSFNPGVAIPRMRYFMITTTRIRPGFDSVYVDYVSKIVNVARQKAKTDNLHVAVFQVTAGAPAGTYMIFRPMKSLAELDDPIGVRVRAAMSDDQKKDADKAVRDAIMSSETSAYAFAPGMSYVEKGFASADPTFWTPKPQTAMKLKPRKRAPKPPPPPPAN
ncbi:MAG: hypothetical protein AABN95_11365 [Acidobacteriota bacterium]